MITRKNFIYCFGFLIFADTPLCAYPTIIEINPLLLINQGLGAYIEHEAFSHTTSLGVGVEGYFQKPYAHNQVEAKRNKWLVAPQFRSYFLTDTLAGPFVGGKLALVQEKSEICDMDTCAQKSKLFMAPMAQAGYRFSSAQGLTLSVYLGVGVRTATNKINDDDIEASKQASSDWQNAKDSLNKQQSLFQPDYGFTIGYIF